MNLENRVFDPINDGEIDLFDNYDALPVDVIAVLDEYQLAENDYDTCMDLVEHLNAIGYTCEFGLDASPYGLKKL